MVGTVGFDVVQVIGKGHGGNHITIHEDFNTVIEVQWKVLVQITVLQKIYSSFGKEQNICSFKTINLFSVK